MTFPKQIQAVLVDFDGTLIDSLPALWDCYKEFMHLHKESPSLEEFRALMGPSLVEIIEYLKEKYKLKGTFEQLYAEYHTLIAHAYSHKVSFYPDAWSVLHLFKARGVKLALVTSASQRLVDLFIENHAIGVFDVIVGQLNKEASKPSPEPYYRALRALGMTNAVSIAIEDSKNGVLSAYRAGICVLRFMGHHLESTDGFTEAYCNLKSWKEIEQLLLPKF